MNYVVFNFYSKILLIQVSECHYHITFVVNYPHASSSVEIGLLRKWLGVQSTDRLIDKSTNPWKPILLYWSKYEANCKLLRKSPWKIVQYSSDN